MSIPSLRIGAFESLLPIVQGGMGGGISLSGLASAVIDNGGIGVIGSIGAGLHENDYAKNRMSADRFALQKEILKVKGKSSGPLGINIMVAVQDCDGLIDVAINAGADILFLGSALPLALPAKAIAAQQAGKISLVPIVSSVRAFELICKIWQRKFNIMPDAVVVEGPLAGGHLGYNRSDIGNSDVTLISIVKQLVPVLKSIQTTTGRVIPLIAGGGIFSGHDIHEIIALGASGVQMATRFVVTEECDATLQFKQAFVDAKYDDIIIIDSPLGLPGRAIRSPFLTNIEHGDKKKIQCHYRCLQGCDPKSAPYCIGDALVNANTGHLEDGFAFAGQNVYRVGRITTVKDLMEELRKEYEQNSI